MEPVRNALCDLNQATERLFIKIEDLIARSIHWATDFATADRRIESCQAPAACSGRQIDAELGQESPNPLRGWRWV